MFVITTYKKVGGESKSKYGCILLGNLLSLVLLVFFIVGFFGCTYYMNDNFDTSYILSINHEYLLHHVSENYLSVALDSSIIQKKWRNFDMNSPTLLTLVSALSPAYFRLGGTAADCLLFDSNTSLIYNTGLLPADGGLCVYNGLICDSFHNNFTMTASDWLRVNKFVTLAGLDLIFDLNVLLRNGDKWDPTNAIELIKFSQKNDLNLTWQLGNEPNSFHHVFNRNVSGTQLAKDFTELRAILNDIYEKKPVLVVGPDITRPRLPSTESLAYLKDFIEEINASNMRVIDAITWHHYYLNGREAKLEDFLNTSNYNILAEQINLVVNTVLQTSSQKLPIWLTETSDAYGGGAPNFTDRFVGGFLWLDKLGLAAYHGLQVVARQSIFGGYYALIDEDLKPLPDFWLSVLHKKFVGTKVLGAKISVQMAKGRNATDEIIKTLRFYSHCAPSQLTGQNESAVTIFGMNIGLETQIIEVKGLESAKYRDTYILTGENGIQSRYTLLNGERLEMIHDSKLPEFRPIIEDKWAPITVPPYTMGFWVYRGIEMPSVCNQKEDYK